MEHGHGGSYRLDPDADARVLVERTEEIAAAKPGGTPPAKPRRTASRDIAADITSATEPAAHQQV